MESGACGGWTAASEVHLPVGEREQEQERTERYEDEASQGDEGADQRPSPCVEQQPAEGLALEQGRLLFGELRVLRSGQRGGAHLRVSLTAGDLREVHVDEVVGVGPGLVAVYELLPGVLLDSRQQRGAVRGWEGDLLRDELVVDHLL